VSKTVVSRATQEQVDVSSKDAQDAALRGDAALLEPTQTVVKGESIMDVPTEQLARAVDMGWKLVDDEEAAGVQLRREETDFASGLQGGVEAALAGASLGLSTAAIDALGGDTERMRARREGLGAVGTGLELAGALVPVALSGGAGLGARGAAGALRYTPAGALELAGAGLERVGVRALSGAPGLVRTVVPMAGRGAVEGFVSGAGAQLHEDVLGDRGISADRLMAAGGMGSLFGGAVGAVIPGVSAAALAGTRLPAAAAGKVLNRASGIVDDLADGHILEKALADGNAGQIAKILGVPEESVGTLLPSLRAAAKGDTELDDLLQSGGVQRFEEDLANGARAPITDVRDAVLDMRMSLGRRSKARMTASKIDPEKAEVAAVRSQETVDDFARQVDQAIARNVEYGGELYDGAVLKQMQKYANRAQMQIADASPKTASRAMPAAKGDPQEIATAAYRALDELKQDADEVMAKVHQSAQRSGSISSSNTMDLILGKGEEFGPLTNVRRHLEDEGVYGSLGAAQKEVNSAVHNAIKARGELADGATKRLLDGRKDIDNRDLLSIVRSSGRFKGEQITEKFREVIAQEIEAARAVAKHYEQTPEQLAKLARAEQALNKLDETFELQRGTREKMDAVEMWRNAEGNRSVSIGSASSVGAELIERGATTAGAAIGGIVGGPVGAFIGAGAGRAVGGVAGLAKRPYTLLRKYTAIMRHINSSEARSTSAIAGFVKKMGTGAAKAAAVGRPLAAGVGRGLKAGAIRGAGASAADKRKRNDDALKRAQMFARNPEILAEEMRSATLNVEDVAPSLTGKMLERATVAAAFLASKAPMKWSDPLGRTELVDRHSQAKFDRYAETILDPLTALTRLEDGTLSLEHAEALREVYPSMFQDIQRRVLDAITADPSIRFQSRVQAGALFSSPFDAMTRPEMVMTTQRALAAPSQPDSTQVDQPRVNGSSAGSLKIGESLSTGAGRIETQQI
jgi:hypothetical protein